MLLLVAWRLPERRFASGGCAGLPISGAMPALGLFPDEDVPCLWLDRCFEPTAPEGLNLPAEVASKRTWTAAMLSLRN